MLENFAGMLLEKVGFACSVIINTVVAVIFLYSGIVMMAYAVDWFSNDMFGALKFITFGKLRYTEVNGLKLFLVLLVSGIFVVFVKTGGVNSVILWMNDLYRMISHA